MDLWAGISNFGGGVFGYTLPFLFILCMVVFFHELGHYLVGRWCGVRVLAFSLGFGREIAAFVDRTGTRWRLAVLPLGGYVKFFGDANAASMPDEEKNALMTPEERKVSFFHKAVWQRAAIVAAGPIANFLLAIVLFTMIFAFYGYQTITPRVNRLVPDNPAVSAGMREGDVVRSIDGHTINEFGDIIANVRPALGRQLQVVVEREGQLLTLPVTPVERDGVDDAGKPIKYGAIGLEGTVKPESLVAATGYAVKETGQQIKVTLSFLARLFTGREDTRNLGGAIKIAQVSKAVTDAWGFTGLVRLAASLSVIVGIMNLLPIPVLDGGHLTFYAIEAIRRRPLAEKVQLASFQIGFALIMMWMLFVNGNDIVNSSFFQNILTFLRV